MPPLWTWPLTLMLAPAPAPDDGVLPLRRIRLHETGVAYYERHGTIDGDRQLALPVPRSHVDDAIKSLVVLDGPDASGRGAAHVRGVSFGTAVSEGMARAMAGLPDEDDGVAWADLLRSLEGTRIAVAVGSRTIEGRLIDVEGPFAPPRVPGEKVEGDDARTPSPPVFGLLVIGSDGALRRLRTDELESIRPLDDGAARRLDVAAEALSDHTARAVQRLDVQVAAGGTIGLGYVAEAPVWRASYRVVLGNGSSKSLLQGWALVHNDTDESWKGVEVELVNGQPASFLFPLAAPRYAHRELIVPEEELSTVPQLARTTADRMWLDGEIGEAFGVGGMGLVGTGRGGGGTGEGVIGMGRVGTIEGVGGSLGDLAELTRASTEDQGALFVYRVRDPVDLAAHHSMLLPIVQETIAATSITLFGPNASMATSAVALVNGTGQTLPAGTIAFFGEGGFVGEALLDRLEPGARCFLVHGAELDVELARGRTLLGHRPMALVFAPDRNALRESRVRISEIDLELDNRSGRAQTVYVGLDLPRNARLEAGDDLELDYDLASATPLAIARLPAREQTRHKLRAEELETVEHDVDAKTLARLLEREGWEDETRAILAEALEHQRRAARLRRRARALHERIGQLEQDAARLRDDLSVRMQRRHRAILGRKLVAHGTQIERLRSEARALSADAADALQRTRRTLSRLAIP